MLCLKGLPVELALDAMEIADYKRPKSKLNTPHDPLHPSNREELGKYLKYCWQTVVRCSTIATELEMDPVSRGNTWRGMNRKNIVSEAIISLFGHHKVPDSYDRSFRWFYDGISRPAWHKFRSLDDPDPEVDKIQGPFIWFV